MEEGVYSVRVRHVSGDIGPFPYPAGAPIASLRGAVFNAWPQDGPLGADRPAAESEVRLICGGKFLADNQILGSFAKIIGSPSPDSVATLHVIVRPAPVGKAAKAGMAAKGDAAGNRCCVIQ